MLTMELTVSKLDKEGRAINQIAEIFEGSSILALKDDLRTNLVKMLVRNGWKSGKYVLNMDIGDSEGSVDNDEVELLYYSKTGKIDFVE